VRSARSVYQPIDHTGDLGMLVFGADLHELFAHAAWGLFDLMTDAERVEPRSSRDLSVEAIDLEDLMVRWLGELLYAYDTDRFLTTSAAFHTLEPAGLRATLGGEKFDAARHPIDTEIKAVTYHQIAVERLDAGWRARVIFDI
jgi:SHS2 domain-containing protein